MRDSAFGSVRVYRVVDAITASHGADATVQRAPLIYLAASRGFAALGRTTERFEALKEALNRHSERGPRAEPGGSASSLVAEARGALVEMRAQLQAVGVVEAPAVTATVRILRGCARWLRYDGRDAEAAEQLLEAPALVERLRSAQPKRDVEAGELLCVRQCPPQRFHERPDE